MTLKEEILKLLDAGFTGEEIKKLYAEKSPEADAGKETPAAASSQEPDKGPGDMQQFDASAFNTALDKTLNGFLDRMDKTIQKININNSFIPGQGEKSMEELLGEVVAYNPGKEN